MKIPDEVIAAIEWAWCPLTAGWDWGDNVSKGQCAVTALLIQDLFGGKLIRGECGKVSHYWNELPDGTEVDLTRRQFGDRADQVQFLNYADRETTQCSERYHTNERYQLLKARYNIRMVQDE